MIGPKEWGLDSHSFGSNRPTLSDIVRHCPTLSFTLSLTLSLTLSDTVRHCPTLSEIVVHIVVDIVIDIVRHCPTLSDIVRHCG